MDGTAVIGWIITLLGVAFLVVGLIGAYKEVTKKEVDKATRRLAEAQSESAVTSVTHAIPIIALPIGAILLLLIREGGTWGKITGVGLLLIIIGLTILGIVSFSDTGDDGDNAPTATATPAGG
jgi:amino acid transporter